MQKEKAIPIPQSLKYIFDNQNFLCIRYSDGADWMAHISNDPSMRMLWWLQQENNVYRSQYKFLKKQTNDDNFTTQIQPRHCYCLIPARIDKMTWVCL